jgi:hypothetical protein
MEIQSRTSLEKCRELLEDNKTISDENILNQRDRQYNYFGTGAELQEISI